MKKYIFHIIMVLLIVLVIGNQSMAKSKKLLIESPIVDENKVTLKWNDIKAGYYIVYRAKLGKNDTGYGAKYEEVAKIKGNKHKYVDKTVKKGKHYVYSITAYKKNGKKLAKAKYKRYVYTKIVKPMFVNDFPQNDLKNTSNSITLSVNFEEDFASGSGITPNGFEVYRREFGSTAWNKVKSIKKRTDELSFTDQTVTLGKIYEYYVKAYWKVKGKKTFKSTRVIKRYAVNDMNHAQFGVDVLTADKSDTNIIEMKLTNSANNGNVVFDVTDKAVVFEMIQGGNSAQKNVEGITAKLDEYSIDGTNWKKASEVDTVELLAGNALYLRFKLYNTATQKDAIVHYDRSTLQTFNMVLNVKRYCDYAYQLNVDMLQHIAKLVCEEN